MESSQKEAVQREETQPEAESNQQSSTFATTWKSLLQQCKQNDIQKISIDDAVIQDLYATKYDKEFETEIHHVPSPILYSLWEKTFYASESYKYEFELQGLGKSQKEAIQKEKGNKRLYVVSLTNYVITSCRDEVIINDRFILKCFEHDLENILSFIFENTKFFKMDISTESLADLYITLACDLSHIKMFTRLLSYVNIQHIEYAIRFATLDFLMLLWKTRKWIPHYDEYMKTLQHTMTNKDWKQLQYFEWWNNHRPMDS